MRSIFAVFLLATSCRLFHPAGRYRITIDLEPQIRALGSDDLFESSPAEDKIVGLGPAALPALEAALEHEPPAVRVGVVEVLLLLGPAGGPLLIKAATDPNEDVRAEALQDLAEQTGDPRARALVEAALDDPSAKIRLAAVRSCAKLCTSPPAIARLVDIALRDELSTNGSWARLSLKWIVAGEDAAAASEARAAITRAALPRLQDDHSFEERTRAALLLADIGSPAAPDVLALAAREAEDMQLRLRAVYTLGIVGDAQAVPTLAGILTGPDSELVPYTCDALARMAARGVPEAKRTLAAYHGPRPERPPVPLL